MEQVVENCADSGSGISIQGPAELSLPGKFVQLALEEKAFQLDGSVFNTIGAMDDIEHRVSTEITADSSLRGLPGVGGPHQFANMRDSIFAGKRQSDHWAPLHECLEFRVEGPFQNVRVVFCQKMIRENHHFASDNF
jgi:hypothetical protein